MKWYEWLGAAVWWAACMAVLALLMVAGLA